ncbi:RDD family protein [Vibrio ostreicida]|uniref:RDD family protein n=2 Tax=Vibrio ostreicida TaxID=526588 RepID=A0ABT8BZB7_9VIBR|nr:RDD family protein [Vibrio ostreicida]MDN3611390.1 RDD family protein [Vibrio ostreicida]NPD09323.1 RDD family protein [Vibrio ostreicida]
MKDEQVEYAGFWVRTAASLIDNILITLIVAPILFWIYGEQYFELDRTSSGSVELLVKLVFFAIVTVIFWVYKSATPGKMLFKLRVVKAESGEPLDVKTSLLRYVGYFISLIPLGLGILWVAFSEKKQGWHDLIAKTVVVRPAPSRAKVVTVKESE